MRKNQHFVDISTKCCIQTILSPSVRWHSLTKTIFLKFPIFRASFLVSCWLSAAASVGKLNYASLTMRAAAEAGCWDGGRVRGWAEQNTRRGHGEWRVRCVPTSVLKILDSTYLGELIMTDPRRRPLVLNLERTVVLHNLHFIHYLPRKNRDFIARTMR